MPALKNARHESFCQNMILHKDNATKSYIEAGYSAQGHAAIVSASRLLSNNKIKNRIDELKSKIDERYESEPIVYINPYLKCCLLDKYGSKVEVTKIIESIITKMITESISIDDVIIRKPIDQMTRYELLLNSGGKCQLCGSMPNKENDIMLHVDHVVPVTKGGQNTKSNYQVLCGACNISKGNRYSINHGN